MNIKNQLEYHIVKQIGVLTHRENVTNEHQKPIRIPYCETNEAASKTFLNKLNQFTNNNFKTLNLQLFGTP